VQGRDSKRWWYTRGRISLLVTRPSQRASSAQLQNSPASLALSLSRIPSTHTRWQWCQSGCAQMLLRLNLYTCLRVLRPFGELFRGPHSLIPVTGVSRKCRKLVACGLSSQFQPLSQTVKSSFSHAIGSAHAQTYGGVHLASVSAIVIRAMRPVGGQCCPFMHDLIT